MKKFVVIVASIFSWVFAFQTPFGWQQPVRADSALYADTAGYVDSAGYAVYSGGIYCPITDSFMSGCDVMYYLSHPPVGLKADSLKNKGAYVYGQYFLRDNVQDTAKYVIFDSVYVMGQFTQYTKITATDFLMKFGNVGNEDTLWIQRLQFYSQWGSVNWNYKNNTVFGGAGAGDSIRYATSIGQGNSFYGAGAGMYCSNSNWNTGIGFCAGQHIAVDDSLNTYIGFNAAHYLLHGSFNTAVGSRVLDHTWAYDDTANANILFGYLAFFDKGGSNNIIIGNEACSSWAASKIDQTLYIDNKDTLYPLIYGRFDSNFVKIYGALFSDSIKVGVGYGVTLKGDSDNISVGYRVNPDNVLGFSSIGIGRNIFDDTLTIYNGNENIAIGDSALGLAYTADGNIAVGYHALQSLSIHDFNTIIGNYSGLNLTGANNVALGYATLRSAGNVNQNVAIGFYAQESLLTGSNNVAIGAFANWRNTAGSRNVCIGDSAGFNEHGSGKLYIANSPTTTPLLYGSFDSNYVRITNQLYVDSAIVIKIKAYNKNLWLGTSGDSIKIRADLVRFISGTKDTFSKDSLQIFATLNAKRKLLMNYKGNYLCDTTFIATSSLDTAKYWMSNDTVFLKSKLGSYFLNLTQATVLFKPGWMLFDQMKPATNDSASSSLGSLPTPYGRMFTCSLTVAGKNPYTLLTTKVNARDTLLIPLWNNHPASGTVGSFALDTTGTDTIWAITQGGLVAIYPTAGGVSNKYFDTLFIYGGIDTSYFTRKLDTLVIAARDVNHIQFTPNVGGSGQDIVANGSGWKGFVFGADNSRNGDYSSVWGGNYNRAGSNYTAVCGGQNDTCKTGTHTFIGGGYCNSVSGTYSALLGGRLNKEATGLYSTIIGGYTNTISGSYSSIIGGYYNNITANYSVILGGSMSDIQSDQHNSVVGGYGSVIKGEVGDGNNFAFNGIVDSCFGSVAFNAKAFMIDSTLIIDKQLYVIHGADTSWLRGGSIGGDCWGNGNFAGTCIIDTTLITGIAATDRFDLTWWGATLPLFPLTGRVAVNTLFVYCNVLDTLKGRSEGYTYTRKTKP